MYNSIKRFCDILLSLILSLILFIPLIVISVIIKITSKGPAIHWSKRVGKNNKIFLMAKFRTMKTDTPQVATHLMTNPESYITPVGKFLRKYSLDELPQLYNIMKGEISFVGPRPALYNQDDLIQQRTEKNIHTIIPGLTGWAQINGRDDLPIPQKVSFDAEYLKKRNIIFDMKIMIITLLQTIKASGVTH